MNASPPWLSFFYVREYIMKKKKIPYGWEEKSGKSLRRGIPMTDFQKERETYLEIDFNFSSSGVYYLNMGNEYRQ